MDSTLPQTNSIFFFFFRLETATKRISFFFEHTLGSISFSQTLSPRKWVSYMVSVCIKGMIFHFFTCYQRKMKNGHDMQTNVGIILRKKVAEWMVGFWRWLLTCAFFHRFIIINIFRVGDQTQPPPSLGTPPRTFMDQLKLSNSKIFICHPSVPLLLVKFTGCEQSATIKEFACT